MQSLLKAVLVVTAFVAPLAAVAQDGAQGNADGDAVLLIAKPELRDPEYRQTVLYVTPTTSDRHIGVIINRPTTRSLASLFPEHEPSKKVIDPVFFGGPFGQSAVFAVVRAKQNPGGGSVAFAKDLYFAARVDVVDKIIERTPNDARYYVGYVGWRSGELRQEIDRGLWYVIDADPDLVFRKEPKGMWEELVRRARQLTAQAPYSGFVLALAR
jgi:putative transcriptional regulator